eukprot:2705938-Rhodomonas_salina.3
MVLRDCYGVSGTAMGHMPMVLCVCSALAVVPTSAMLGPRGFHTRTGYAASSTEQETVLYQEEVMTKLLTRPMIERLEDAGTNTPMLLRL